MVAGIEETVRPFFVQPINLPQGVAQSPPNRVILLVDDSRVQRRILRAQVERLGYDVLEAASGGAALDICGSRHVDFIISDWMMPGMTGLEFCQRFRALDRPGYGYFVLLTSKSETSEVVRGLEVGADDFLTKPVNSHELRARLAAGERVLGMEQQLQEKTTIIGAALSELQSLYDAIDRDLLQARTIQESLIPEKSIAFGPSRVSLLMKTCGHVGGDLVGAFSPGKNRLAFYSIDVSGHGITSALMTARLAGYLSGKYLDHNIATEKRFSKFFALRQPEDVARALNERLMTDNGVGEYFTMAYAIADLTTGHLRIVQAGHPYPMVQRRTGAIEVLGQGGAPVGLLEDVAFEAFDLTLEVGDRLFFFSDGFTETVTHSGKMLEEEGMARLIDAVRNAKGLEALDDLYWMLSQERAAPGADDDVSAVLFEYQGPVA